MTRALVVLVGAVFALGLGSAALAPAATADPSAPAAQRRANIKKRIAALRASALTTALDLDSQTAAKLTSVLDKYDDETDQLVQRRVELAHKLAEPPSNGEADKLIEQAIANAKAFRDLEDRRLADIRKVLTPTQTAKLLVVLPEFERRIQNQLKNAIQNAPGGHKARDDDE